MHDLTAKLKYCLRMMALSERVAAHVRDDYQSRVLGRMVFVYLDSFIPLGLQIKNRLAAPATSKSQLKARLLTLKSEYDDLYEKVRHNLAAHRQDLEWDEAADVWNEIDTDSIEWFLSEVIACYQELIGYLPRLNHQDTTPTMDDNLAAALGQIEPLEGVRMGIDTLAATRPNTVTIIPTHILQTRGIEILSISDMITLAISLAPLTQGRLDFGRLVKSMLVMDICNFVDRVYGGKHGGRQRDPSFIDIIRPIDCAAAHVFDTIRPPSREVTTLRDVRNRISAHVDRKAVPLPDLLRRLDLVDDSLLNAVYGPASEAFDEACRICDVTRMFFIHNQELRGAISAQPIPEMQKPYRR